MSRVGAEFREARPVHMKFAKGRKSKGRKGAAHVNDMKRDVFGDGLGIEASLAPVPSGGVFPAGNATCRHGENRP